MSIEPSSALDDGRLLIVNADDFGITPGVCDAVLAAHERGIVTSTSALVVAPAWARYAAALAGSGIGVGLHLCVVGEDPPVLSAREVPSLVGSDGRFPQTWRQFIARSATGRVDTDDLRREFAAQHERIEQSGVRLTHLDSHQNLHQWPQVSRLVLELASQHRIGAVRVTRSRGWAPGALGTRVLGARFARSAQRASLAWPEASTGLDEAGRLSLPNLVAALERLAASDGRSAELATHPGLAVDPERDRYRWGYWWAEEFEALCHRTTRQTVDRLGFHLGDFSDLVERFPVGHAEA